MIEWIQAPDDVVALRYVGKISKEEIDEAFEVARKRLNRHKTIAVVADISKWEGFNGEGLVELLRERLRSLKWTNRVRAKAVISDSHGWQAYTAFIGSLVHQPQLRAFPVAQAKEAVRWASQPAEALAPA